jgi:hypothetical protein
MKLSALTRVLLPVAAVCAGGLIIAGCSSDAANVATATASPASQASTATGNTSPAASRTVSPTVTGTSSAGTDTPTVAKPPAYDDSTDPLRMITSYVNAINRQEYERAYGYWHKPSQSLADFEKGYATTTNVTATVASASGIDAATSQRRTLISTVLVSTHTDGSTERFSGCYVAWQTVPGVSDNPNDSLWHIEEATVTDAPKSSPVAYLLAKGCESYKDRVANYGQAYDDQGGALNVVLSLYDALNRKDYHRAYAYWEQAPSSYDDFAAGYADTKSAVVTTGTPTGKGAAAGSVYESIPVVVTGTLTDGTVQRYAGCYVGRKSDIPKDGTADPSGNPWKIYSGKLQQANDADSDTSLLAAACENAS